MEWNSIQIIDANNSESIKTIDDFYIAVIPVLAMCQINSNISETVAEICFGFIKSHYASFTKKNFTQAFEFNIACVLPKKVEHFQSFTPEFMCDVLNQYLELKRKAQLDFERAKNSIKKPEQPSTGKQSFEALSKFVDDNKMIPKFWDWSKVFYYMEDRGMIRMSNKEKFDLMELMKQKIEAKKKQAVHLDEILNIEKELSENNLVLECRKYSIVKAIEKMKGIADD